MISLLSLLFVQQAAAISCDSNNPCPWYTFAQCCGNVCWAFSDITQCKSLECTACETGAAAAISAGGSAACDAVTVAACEGLGGGPEDPFADLCAASAVAICTAVWNKGLNKPDAVCQDVGMCSSMADESVAPLPGSADLQCTNCLKTFGNNGGCEAAEDGDYTKLKKTVQGECVESMKDPACRAQVQEFCLDKKERKANLDRLASSEQLGLTCNTVGDTWDYCRWGPLKDPLGVEIVSGSTYTFKLNYSSEKFHWTCAGSDEYSRVDRANYIEAHYQTDGHIHWVGKACYGLGVEAAKATPQTQPAGALTETCNTVGDTWDYCRGGPLKDPKGVEIISGATYTFKLNYSSERFHWTCSGSDEYSRIDRANTIEAHYGTDGHIHWIGKACFGLEGEQKAAQPQKPLLTWNADTQNVEVSKDVAVTAGSLTETCYTVGDTWDYCRWGPLKDPTGVEIISGSTYTFKLNYSSEKFHWTCSGSDEYSRVDRANTIEAHYGTDGHIHWIGKACSGLGEEKKVSTPLQVPQLKWNAETQSVETVETA